MCDPGTEQGLCDGGQSVKLQVQVGLQEALAGRALPEASGMCVGPTFGGASRHPGWGYMSLGG